MPTSSMARHQWAAKLAKRPTIGCRPQPEGAGTVCGRGAGVLRAGAGARERERRRLRKSTGARAREHTGVFICARKRNVRTRGCRSAPAVSRKWHEIELSGGRYIGEAENGKKLNFPSLDPLDSMLSDSESSISCPKSSHEQVEKLGKFEIVPKIRARLFGDSESPKSCPPPDEKSQQRAFGAFC